MYDTLNDRAKDLQDELKKMSMGKARRLYHAWPVNPVFAWLSDYNEMMENAVRVAAFSVAVEQGMSPAQAAALAKELTVNFNRKAKSPHKPGPCTPSSTLRFKGTARNRSDARDARKRQT